MKAIAGIQKIHAGNITKYTEKISYIPQKLELDTTFPLIVNEFFQIFNAKASKQTIDKYLKLFDIKKLISQGESFKKYLF